MPAQNVVGAGFSLTGVVGVSKTGSGSKLRRGWDGQVQGGWVDGHLGVNNRVRHTI